MVAVRWRSQLCKVRYVLTSGQDVKGVKHGNAVRRRADGLCPCVSLSTTLSATPTEIRPNVAILSLNLTHLQLHTACTAMLLWICKYSMFQSFAIVSSA